MPVRIAQDVRQRLETLNRHAELLVLPVGHMFITSKGGFDIPSAIKAENRAQQFFQAHLVKESVVKGRR